MKKNYSVVKGLQLVADDCKLQKSAFKRGNGHIPEMDNGS